MQDKMKSLITNIKLDAATFHGETVEPTYINFFFGKNGAGKTTVASAFEDPSCLEWQSGINPTDYTILVYNQEFINRNLANYGDLKGVFTLSKENAETRKQIDDKTEERKTVIADGRQAAEDRDKKNGELKPLRDSFETTCWEDTEDIRRSFDQTQTGKKKKLQFTDEVLSGKHKPIEHKKEDIQKLYDIAYDPKARKYPSFNTSAELEGVYDLTGEHFLAEEVTSRSETQFAQFMKALNATEWVKQGHADYVAGHDEGKCPFCQRKLPDTFEKDIAEAFDEGYQKALDALETFEIEYARKMAALLELLKNNLTDVFPKAKTDEYEKLVAQLETVITENEQLIAKKRTSPGEPVALKDTDAILSDIDTAIAGINKLIQENNDIVATKPDKQLECFNMVWEEIAFILKEKVAAYIKSKGDMNKMYENNKKTNTNSVTNTNTSSTQNNTQSEEEAKRDAYIKEQKVQFILNGIKEQTAEQKQKIYEYLESRNLDRSLVDKYNIFYSDNVYEDKTQGIEGTPRMVIPVYLNGQPFSYVARALINDVDAGMKVVNSARTGQVPLNIEYIKENAGDNKTIYVCEGWADAFSIEATGNKAIALHSTQNTKKLFKAITDNMQTASQYIYVLCCDNDEAGQRANEEMKKYFVENKIKYAVLNIDSNYHDINEWYVAVKDAEAFKNKINPFYSHTNMDYIDNSFLNDIKKLQEYKSKTTGFKNLDKELNGIYPRTICNRGNK